MQEALNYDRAKQEKVDDGIFWMCFEDLMQFFTAVYLNWNPELFSIKITQHGFWPANIGPKNDQFNLGYNPQYRLEILNDNKNNNNNNNKDRNNDKNGSVWILLSKHMKNTKRDEQSKNDFLTLHVYDNVETIDGRVYHRKNAKYTGVYINSPHYLMKLDIDISDSNCSKKYTIVVSQYEKNNDVSFTVTAYSSLLPIRFKPVPTSEFWKYTKTVTSQWTQSLCGGSPNYDTFVQNPQFKLKVGDKCHIRWLLEAPIDYSVNIQIYKLFDENIEKITEKQHYSRDLLVADSGFMFIFFVFTFCFLHSK